METEIAGETIRVGTVSKTTRSRPVRRRQIVDHDIVANEITKTILGIDRDENFNKLPEHIQHKLSGLGEPPQLGNAVTLANIQQAIRTSERGEPYYLFALFRDMIENDSHMQAEIGKRIMSFMGPTETIEPFDKSNPDDVAAAEVIKEMIENCDNWDEGSLHLANGHIWPIAGCEKIYAPVDGHERHNFKYPVQYRLKKLHPIPYALYTYKVAYWNVNMGGSYPEGGMTPQGVLTNTGAMPIQDTQNKTALNYQAYEKENDSVLVWNPNDWHSDLRFYSTFANGLLDWTMQNCYKPDPTRHVLHSASVATTSMRENFGGVLRGLIPWWFFSQNGRDWFARAMERYASPFAVAYANTANKNVFDLLTKAFNQATKVNALIVPPQAKIELKEIQVSNMADGYAKFIELCNTEKTKAILGQTLSTTSKGSGMMGGSGVADLHGEVRAEWCMYDKRRYSEMQKDQIFDPYLRINGYRGRCRSIRGGITPANQAVLATTLQKLALAGIFVDETAEQDLTNTFGMKLKIKDITQMQGDKSGKSLEDKSNHGKPGHS